MTSTYTADPGAAATAAGPHTGWQELPAAGQPAQDARARTRSTLTTWGLPRHLVGDAELVATELVTNAVRHGRGPVRLRLALEDQHLVVAVADCDPHPVDPAARAADDDESGRGLAIVAGLSQHHGCTVNGRRKVMWAALATTATGVRVVPPPTPQPAPPPAPATGESARAPADPALVAA